MESLLLRGALSIVAIFVGAQNESLYVRTVAEQILAATRWWWRGNTCETTADNTVHWL